MKKFLSFLAFALFANILSAQNIENKDSIYLNELKLKESMLIKQGLLDSAAIIAQLKLNTLKENELHTTYLKEAVATAEGFANIRQGMRVANLLEEAILELPQNVDTTSRHFTRLMEITGKIYLRNRGLLKAIEKINRHKNIMESLENPDMEELGRCYENLAEANIFMGMPEIYQNIQKAFDIFHNLGDPYKLAKVQGNLGQVMFLVNPLMSFEILKQAEKNYKRSKLTTPKDIAVLNMYMGMSLSNQKKKHEAYEKYQIAYNSFSPLNKDDSTFILALSVNYASSCQEIKEYSKMGELIDMANGITTKLFPENSYQQSVVDGLKAQWLYEKGSYDSAIHYRNLCINKQLKLFGNKGHRIGHSYMIISDSYKAMQNLDLALENIQKALMTDFPDVSNDENYEFIPPVANNLNSTVTIQHFEKKINVLIELYERDKDLKWLQLAHKHFLACDTLMNIQQQSWLDEDMLVHNEVNRDFYNEAVENALFLYNQTGDDKYFKSAYHFATSSKNKLLVYQIKRLEKYQSSPNIEDVEKLNQEILVKELEKKYEDAQKEGNINEVDSLEYQLFSSKLTLMIENDKIKNEDPKHTSIELSDFQLNIEKLVNKLNSKTAVLEYFIGNDKLYIFSFTDKGMNVETVEIGEEFESSLNQYKKEIKTGTRRPSSEISKYLLKPVQEIIAEKESLIILPYAKLLSIPFDALRIPGSEEMLIEQYSIAYNYSAPLYLRSIERKENLSKEKSIALYAPGFIDEGIAALSSKNVYRSSEFLIEEEIVDSKGMHLASLPYSINEVDDISELFNSKGWKCDKFDNENATEENFKENAPHNRIVHIATHGFSDNENEEASGLFFSQWKLNESNKKHEEDGFLYLKEIYDLELKSDLVVLSACKSGIGKIFEAEGVYALPRGFIYSGVSNLIVSLWKIHDKKTKDLMVSFYKHYLEGDDYAKALREAKLEMISKGNLPIDWSGIILIGN